MIPTTADASAWAKAGNNLATTAADKVAFSLPAGPHGKPIPPACFRRATRRQRPISWTGPVVHDEPPLSHIAPVAVEASPAGCPASPTGDCPQRRRQPQRLLGRRIMTRLPSSSAALVTSAATARASSFQLPLVTASPLLQFAPRRAPHGPSPPLSGPRPSKPWIGGSVVSTRRSPLALGQRNFSTTNSLAYAASPASSSLADMEVSLKARNGQSWEQPIGLFINNEFVPSSNGQKLTTVDPAYVALVRSCHPPSPVKALVV